MNTREVPDTFRRVSQQILEHPDYIAHIRRMEMDYDIARREYIYLVETTNGYRAYQRMTLDIFDDLATWQEAERFLTEVLIQSCDYAMDAERNERGTLIPPGQITIDLPMDVLRKPDPSQPPPRLELKGRRFAIRQRLELDPIQCQKPVRKIRIRQS